MGGEGQFLKRIPRIKFPPRRTKSSTKGATSHSRHESTTSKSPEVGNVGSDVQAPAKATGVGGKASLQPERTPVSPNEIEAILLGGCI